MAAQTGFLKCGTTARLSCRLSGAIGYGGPAAPVTCPAEVEDRRVTIELDVVGLSWTTWDMIQNVPRADQEHSETTDATRTNAIFTRPGMEYPQVSGYREGR